MATKYTVKAPMVVARRPAKAGGDLYLSRGATVPEDVPAEVLKRLADRGLIEPAKPSRPTSRATGSKDKGKVPTKSASKGDWETYALSQGMSEQDAAAATKDDLVEKFTGDGQDDGSGSPEPS